MSRVRRFMSQAEAEDLAVTCSLTGSLKLSVITRRSALRGGSEESAIVIRSVSDDAAASEKSLFAIAIVATLRYEFVGNGVFSIAPKGDKNKEVYYFQTTSLHDMWATLTILEETRELAQLDNISTADGHEEWLRAYFQDNLIRISPFAWEGQEGAKTPFLNPPLESSTPPARPYSENSSTKWCKPDLEELKKVISNFIKSSEDPDDITEGDVIEHLKGQYGMSIVGKYGYSKSEIQRWTYTYYGQLDKPSQIDDLLFLGSEYNAANFEELRSLGVTHILNVTCEVSRFYPNEFQYHQVHVLDVPSVNLLPYFSRALSFMESALQNGGGVL